MFPKVSLRQYFSAAGTDALDLLEKMLVFDPAKRWTTEDVSQNALGYRRILNDTRNPIGYISALSMRTFATRRLQPRLRNCQRRHPIRSKLQKRWNALQVPS